MSDANQISDVHSPTSDTVPLLLEIGCEEIPARFLTQAQKDLGDRLMAALEGSRLVREDKLALSQGERVSRSSVTGEGSLQPAPQPQTHSTPRRLVAYVPHALARQPDKTEEIAGPSVKVAVDAQGKYTKAAESFARKNGAETGDLTRITTPKGEYVAVKKTTHGRSAIEVLSEILPGVITGISFPKSMYWTGKSGPRFVRPIRWILALLGEGDGAQVIPFEIAGVKAGDSTLGHRALGRGPLRVSGFKDYVQKLNDSQVELEPEKRRERVLAECKAILEGSGLRVVEDNDLVDWIVNSTEWPRALQGSFEERFLKLPREILVTVMRDHQKYFAVEDEKGSLRPSLVTLLNVEGDAQDVIRRGHERVLTARFSDAEFFWNADQKIPLRDRVPMLEKVTYQAKLGTYGDKVKRMLAVAQELCRELSLPRREWDAAIRAVELCKCDLTTQMVQEFPELQGIVGGLYARGEDVLVGEGIYDHYHPLGLEDQSPRNLVGAVVSFADKLDSVVAGFAGGLKPSGSSDPFGLRRQANGVMKLLLESFPPLLFSSLATKAVDQFGGPKKVNWMYLETFFLERLSFYLERHVRPDTVKAVLTDHEMDGINVPAQMLHRAQVLERIRDSNDFVAMAQAAKRIRNIITKSGVALAELGSGRLNETILEGGAERELFEKYREAYDKLEVGAQFWAGGTYDYEKVFAYIASLRPEVDRYFDKVHVMADDLATRVNRLVLLHLLDQQIFSKFVRLSEIEGDTSIPVGASTTKAVASDE